MAKKLFIPIIILCLLLCSCSSGKPEHITPVENCFKGYSSDYSFTLRVELGGSLSLMLSEGTVEKTQSPNTLKAETENTFRGENAGVSTLSWENGVLTADGVSSEQSWEQLTSALTYATPYVFDSEDIYSTEATSTLAGTLYRHYIKDNTKKNELYDALGDELPMLCGVKSVDKEATSIKSLMCEYTLDENGKPAMYTISFVIAYQDTPPYVPGVEQNKKDYVVEAKIELMVKFK